MLFDTHCHIHHQQFDPDRAQTMQRAREAGVGLLLCIGHNRQHAHQAVALAAENDWIYATVGLHPHDAKDWTPALQDELRALAESNPRVRAIGEVGLDYHYDFSPRETMHAVFRHQIALAKELSLPLVIHAREADADVLRILREEGAGEVGGIMHCFAGDWEMAKQCMDLNFYIGLGGSVTFAKNQVGREVAAQVPLDRLVLETDAPYLAPVPNRGKRNEPAFVALVARFIAELRHMSLEELAEITTANGCSLLKI